MAETKKEATAAFDLFVETYGVKYEKAVGKLIKDRAALLACLMPSLPNTLMIAVNGFVTPSRPAQLPEALFYRCTKLGVELRRRLSILSCAGWIPHDRGCVLELPLSGNERQPFKD